MKNIKTKKTINMLTKNRRLISIILAAGVLLLIPFIAMQFSTGVDWSSGDFLIMGVLLLSTGIACEIVMRKIKKIEHRIALCAGILIVLFLIWAELAVGVFGTMFAGS